MSDCSGWRWSKPQLLADQVGEPFTRFISIIPSQRGFILAGNRVGEFPRDPAASGPTPAHGRLALLQPNGSALPSPSGDFQFLHPVGSVGADGRFWMAWAEPAPGSGAPNWFLQAPRTIWVSSLSNAAWSKPLQVFEGDFLWAKGARDDLTTTMNPFGLVVASLNEGISFITVSGGLTSSKSIPRTTGAVSPSLVTIGRTLVVAYVGVRDDVQEDRNSLFVIRSVDGGKTWGRPALVSAGGARPANNPLLRVGPDGGITLTWRQQAPNGQPFLYNSRSGDGGATWEAMAPLRQPDGLRFVTAAVDGCRRLHLVAEFLVGARSHLAEAIWDGKWSAFQPLVATGDPADPTLARAPDGTLLLGFIAGASASDKSTRTFWSALK